MEATHIQKYLHTSPRKLRLVADLVRKTQPVQAISILGFTPKAASLVLSKAIKTALGNAKQKGMEADQLEFKTLSVEESLKMRRMRAGTRGRAKPYKRRMAHIKIVLTDIQNQKSKIKMQNQNNSSRSKIKKEEITKKVALKEKK